MVQSKIFQLPAGVLEDTHIDSSRAMIAQAATLADSGYAAVLGCGQGADIPLHQLGTRFKRVDLIDLDGSALQAVQARSQQWTGMEDAFAFHHVDLTGLIPQLEPIARDITTQATEPLTCLTQLGELLASATPNFWRPADGEMYRLVVCSAVLTQLQAAVRTRIENLFRDRFPEAAAALSTHEPWRQSIWNFARHLEDAFIKQLESLTTSDAVVYLSDTVHACWLIQSDPYTFSTEGSWIALRTSRLADYLSPFQSIVTERQWQWLLPLHEGPYWGRLYGVQAIIYRPH